MCCLFIVCLMLVSIYVHVHGSVWFLTFWRSFVVWYFLCLPSFLIFLLVVLHLLSILSHHFSSFQVFLNTEQETWEGKISQTRRRIICCILSKVFNNKALLWFLGQFCGDYGLLQIFFNAGICPWRMVFSDPWANQLFGEELDSSGKGISVKPKTSTRRGGPAKWPVSTHKFWMLISLLTFVD